VSAWVIVGGAVALIGLGIALAELATWLEEKGWIRDD